MNICCKLAYDGKDFFGFQAQNTGQTIEGSLLQTLHRIEGRKIKLYAAGRTDSGVHARGQVINFNTSRSDLTTEKWKDALNGNLPPAIRIMETKEVDEDFHARYSAKAREYWYYIYNNDVMDPFFRNYSYMVRHRLDIDRLNELALPLQERQLDFSSFCLNKPDENIRMVRSINTIKFYRQEKMVIMKIKARSFLHSMVRIIVGTLLKFTAEKKGIEDLEQLIQVRDNRQAGPSAPAWGLFLHKVYY